MVMKISDNEVVDGDIVVTCKHQFPCNSISYFTCQICPFASFGKLSKEEIKKLNFESVW